MRPFLSYTYYNIVRKEKKEISTKEKSLVLVPQSIDSFLLETV